MVFQKNFYGNTDLFRGVEEATLTYLLKHSVFVNVSRNTTILQQGDEHHFLYLILRGRIKTLRQNEKGEEAVIRLLEAGDTFMDAVIFMDEVSPIAVRSIEESRLLKIPAPIVREMLQKDPRLSLNMLNIVASHYKNSMEQIDAMRIKNPTERVGYYLLSKYLKHLKKGGSQTSFRLAFHKQDIANQLGITPETLSRTLKNLRELGINLTADRVEIKSPLALCSFCDLTTASKCRKRNSAGCENHNIP